jgi:multidrug transporter EmrE-like cation transporter
VSLKLLVVIFGSVALSAIAQILLKIGMSSASVQQALTADGYWDAVRSVGTSTHVIAGLALYGLGAVVWLLVLARVDVSVAYPFVGAGFILTMVLGWLVLNEPIGTLRLTGTALVALGVYLVARS